MAPIWARHADDDRLVREPDATLSSELFVDLGTSFLGHVTRTTATFFVNCSGIPLSEYAPVVTVTAADGTKHRAPFNAVDGVTDVGVATVRELRRGTSYAYVVNTSSSLELGEGTFTTDNPAAEEVRSAFLSCNKLVTTERWDRLSREPALDLTMMTGDQIYESGMPEGLGQDGVAVGGDLCEAVRTSGRPAGRRALRQSANYMILDDHDVKDDLGVVEVAPRGMRAAHVMYRSYQQSHGPLGPVQERLTTRSGGARWPSSFWTSALSAPASGGVLDEEEDAADAWTTHHQRSPRGRAGARLRVWARSDEARTRTSR